MHISEMVLSFPVIGAGFAATIAGTLIGLLRLDPDKIMTTALLGAAFFVASLIHVPIGGAQAHLLLSGLLGFVLGWAAFPAILVGLVLQAILFQYGALTTLGVNTFNMAFPAVVCALTFKPLLGKTPLAHPVRTGIASFLAGSLAMIGSSLLTALSLAFTDEGFLISAKVLVLGHLPISAIEGVITIAAVTFLAKVKPEALFPAKPRPAFQTPPLSGE
ncbi:MAG: cobalt transporter CbiM [Desulfovibrio sp.]|nr:MAG: cobalt transporter CbiM [Desulfovibrio sp.]